MNEKKDGDKMSLLKIADDHIYHSTQTFLC